MLIQPILKGICTDCMSCEDNVPSTSLVLHRETFPLFLIWILPVEFQACSFLFLLLERFKQDYHNISNNFLYHWKLLSCLFPTSLQNKGLLCVSWCFLGALTTLLSCTVPALFIQESCWSGHNTTANFAKNIQEKEYVRLQFWVSTPHSTVMLTTHFHLPIHYDPRYFSEEMLLNSSFFLICAFQLK